MLLQYVSDYSKQKENPEIVLTECHLLYVWESDMRMKTIDFERIKKWGNLDLNQGPAGYESAALTTELLPQEMD